jgi:hypothetical protein
MGFPTPTHTGHPRTTNRRGVPTCRAPPAHRTSRRRPTRTRRGAASPLPPPFMARRVRSTRSRHQQTRHDTHQAHQKRRNHDPLKHRHANSSSIRRALSVAGSSCALPAAMCIAVRFSCNTSAMRRATSADRRNCFSSTSQASNRSNTCAVLTPSTSPSCRSDTPASHDDTLTPPADGTAPHPSSPSGGVGQDEQAPPPAPPAYPSHPRAQKAARQDGALRPG